MDTIHVFLKVAKLENRGQFERYEVRNMPKFQTVNEVKTFLLSNYKEEIRPATDCSFTLKFTGEGRTKCDIKAIGSLEMRTEARSRDG